MSKRFTDTEKWDNPWFMDLPWQYKLAYQYMQDKCSNIGVWTPNKRLLEFFVGQEIDWDDFLEHMKGKVRVLEDGGWWLLEFIDFQYGVLDESSNAKPIQSYIKELKKHTLWIDYSKGINTLKEKEKEKDKEKEKEKGLKKFSKEEYLSTLEAFREESRGNGLAAQFQKEFPELDIIKSMNRIYNYWVTDEGYERKRKLKTRKIDWKATFKNGLGQNWNRVLKDGME